MRMGEGTRFPHTPILVGYVVWRDVARNVPPNDTPDCKALTRGCVGLVPLRKRCPPQVTPIEASSPQRARGNSIPSQPDWGGACGVCGFATNTTSPTREHGHTGACPKIQQISDFHPALCPGPLCKFCARIDESRSHFCWCFKHIPNPANTDKILCLDFATQLMHVWLE